MSSIKTNDIECSSCRKNQEVTIYESVNVTLSPNLLEKVKNRKINNFDCKNCKKHFEIMERFLYHDQDKKYFIWCLPDDIFTEIMDSEDENKLLVQSFKKSIKENIFKEEKKSKLYSFILPKYKIHDVVFGYDELFKCLGWENNIDLISTKQNKTKKEENESKALVILYEEYPELKPENDEKNELFSKFQYTFKETAEEFDYNQSELTEDEILKIGRYVMYNILNKKALIRINNVKPKILIFTEDISNANIDKMSFEKDGWDVVIFNEIPDNLLEIVANENPDLISSETLPSKIDGYKLLNILSKDNRPDHYSVILREKPNPNKGNSIKSIDDKAYLLKGSYSMNDIFDIYRRVLGLEPRLSIKINVDLTEYHAMMKSIPKNLPIKERTKLVLEAMDKKSELMINAGYVFIDEEWTKVDNKQIHEEVVPEGRNDKQKKVNTKDYSKDSWENLWKNISKNLVNEIKDKLGMEDYRRLSAIIQKYDLFHRVYLGKGKKTIYGFSEFLNQSANLLWSSSEFLIIDKYCSASIIFLFINSCRLYDSYNFSHAMLAIFEKEVHKNEDSAKYHAEMAKNLYKYLEENNYSRKYVKQVVGLKDIENAKMMKERIELILSK